MSILDDLQAFWNIYAAAYRAGDAAAWLIRICSLNSSDPHTED